LMMMMMMAATDEWTSPKKQIKNLYLTAKKLGTD
jgi:hypothetical protein